MSSSSAFALCCGQVSGGWSLSICKNHLAVSDRLGVRGRHLSAELMFFGGVIKDGFDLHSFVHLGWRPTPLVWEFAAYTIPSPTAHFQNPRVVHGVIGQCCVKKQWGRQRMWQQWFHNSFVWLEGVVTRLMTSRPMFDLTTSYLVTYSRKRLLFQRVTVFVHRKWQTVFSLQQLSGNK